jgi:HEAT repeat protein
LKQGLFLKGWWLVACLFPAYALDEASASEPQSARRYDGRTLEEWRQAIKDLSPDNPASRAAVPGLIAILKDQDAPWFTRRQMANTLGRFGKNAPEAVPVLIKILDEPNTDEHTPRIWASKSLALFGPEAREAAPRLVAILKNAELPIAEREVALEALGQIGGAHPRAIPAVVETLNLPQRADSPKAQEERNTLRELAAESLTIVGKDAAIAVPVLLRSINDPREAMRRKTIAALGRIGPASQSAIPTLIESLAFDESPAVRDAAETALAGIGTVALPALMHLLEDQETELRLRAARGLGQMKTTGQPAAAKLRELLKDEEPEVRFTAARSLWQITLRAEFSLPVFVETLKSPDRQLRMQAFRALTTELGPAAAPAREALTQLLEHPEPSVRQAAQKALERIPANRR